MRWLKFAISCYLVIVFQTGFLAVLFPDSFRPFLPVILANLVLLSWPVEQALICVWIIGLLVDLTSIVPIGVISFCFGIYSLIVLVIRPVLFLESPFAHAFTASLGIIVIYSCYLFIGIFSGIPPLPINIFGILGQMIATGLAAAVLSQVFRKRFTPKRNKYFLGAMI